MKVHSTLCHFVKQFLVFKERPFSVPYSGIQSQTPLQDLFTKVLRCVGSNAKYVGFTRKLPSGNFKNRGQRERAEIGDKDKSGGAAELLK